MWIKSRVNSESKNQLEIEKSELQSKYNTLEKEYDSLKLRFNKIKALKEKEFEKEKNLKRKLMN